MKFKIRVQKVGNSKVIILPHKLVKEEGIELNDNLEVEIISMTKRIKSYGCKRCENKFDSDDILPYCSVCDADGDDIELVLDDLKKVKGGTK